MDGLVLTDNPDSSIYAKELFEKTTDELDPIRERVFEKVLELTDSYQELFRLYYIEGYSQEEIARLQSINQKNVCIKLGKLKKHLIRMCHEEK